MVTLSTGGGAGAGKVNLGQLNVTKSVDVATPTLWSRMATGRSIRDATLAVRRIVGDGIPQEYLKILCTVSRLLLRHCSGLRSSPQHTSPPVLPH